VVDHLIELMEYVGRLGIIGIRPSSRPERGGKVILLQLGQYAGPPIIGLVQRNEGSSGCRSWGASAVAFSVIRAQ